MNNLSKLAGAAALLALLALAGCGGGGGGAANNSDPGGSQNQSTTEVPDSAGRSSSAFVAFLKTMAQDDETSEPMTLREGWAVPADDTGDAEPVG